LTNITNTEKSDVLSPGQRLRNLLKDSENEITITMLTSCHSGKEEHQKWNNNRVSKRTIFRILSEDENYSPSTCTRNKLKEALEEDIFTNTKNVKKMSLNSYSFSDIGCMGCKTKKAYKLYLSRHFKKSYGAVSSSRDNKNFDIELALCSDCITKHNKFIYMGYSDLYREVINKVSKQSLPSKFLNNLAEDFSVTLPTLNRIKNDKIKFIKQEIALELHLVAMNISQRGFYGDYDWYRDVYLGKEKLEEVELHAFDEDEVKELIDDYLETDKFDTRSQNELEHLVEYNGWQVESETSITIGHMEWIIDENGDEISVYAMVSFSYCLRSGYPYFEVQDDSSGELQIRSTISDRYGVAELAIVE
jgi:hypothetical protein